MGLYRGLFLIIAFLGWFLYQWYQTKDLKTSLKLSAPAFFFILAWVVAYFVIMRS